MLLLHEYTLGETLYEGPETCIRRALHHPSGEQVVIKQPISDHPSLHIIGRLVHEHRILAGLSHIPGIVRVRALERSAGSAALVLDDLGQQSLDRVLAKRGRLSFATALRIASGLCQTLDGVHAAGVMHKEDYIKNTVCSQVSP